MNLWFTADTHFNHDKIRKYCDRPFHSLDHMDRELIRRWNERVKPEDTVFHLGDFNFRKSEYVVNKSGPVEITERILKGYKYYADQLNGKIILLRGNHDAHNDVQSPITSMVINYGGIDWWMAHEPVAQFKYNLCGHVHNNWRIQHAGQSIILNVGVDVWQGYPISLGEILRAINDYQNGRMEDFTWKR